MKDKTNISDNATLGYTYLNSNNELIITGDRPVVLSTSSGDTSYKPLILPANLKGGIAMAKRKSANEIYVLNYDGIYLLNELTNTALPLTKIFLLRGPMIYGWTWKLSKISMHIWQLMVMG